MNRVCSQLSIASIEQTQNKDTRAFDVVVSVCQDTCVDNVSDETTYEHVPLADDCGSEYNWGGRFDYEHFREAVNIVVRHLFSDNKTLVHCHKGRNRSVSVAIAAYAIWKDIPYERALPQVRDFDRERPDEEQLAFARHAIANSPMGGSR